MDGATIQARLYAGYAKAARVIGTTYHHYRPTSTSNPVSVATQLADMPVSLNADDPTYARPNVYGKATWYGVMDGAQLAVGDYIVGIEGTFFIAALQQLLPIFLVSCNRVATVSSAASTAAAGLVAYNADLASTETALMTAWPCSILQGSKGEHNSTDLPGDVRTPWMKVLMPAWAGVIINTGDIITDDLGRRLIASNPELTDLGWNVTAIQAQT